jgi:hypothetical protein
MQKTFMFFILLTVETLQKDGGQVQRMRRERNDIVEMYGKFS